MATQTATALHEHGATELARLIRLKQVSSREVVQGLLDRIRAQAIEQRRGRLTPIDRV